MVIMSGMDDRHASLARTTPDRRRKPVDQMSMHDVRSCFAQYHSKHSASIRIPRIAQMPKHSANGMLLLAGKIPIDIGWKKSNNGHAVARLDWIRRHIRAAGRDHRYPMSTCRQALT